MRTLTGYVIGFVTLEIQQSQVTGAPPPDPRYPQTAALAAYRPTPDAQFDTGLATVLTGLASLATA